MLRARLLCLLPTVLLACPLIAIEPAKPAPPQLAAAPPMGWNSWDAYGLTVDEAQYRANVQVLASMKEYGWQYAVIDEGWYMQDPFAENSVAQKLLYDGNGLLVPVVSRFPSSANNAGFKPLADWVHSLGLKFGIHILRGIPKQVVDENLPVAGSSFRAADAVDKSATCPWSDVNYGVADNPAGQAYYDSMLKRYADWGLDFIKVDCISDRPYRISEIRQVAEAIRKTGRPILLSLSPGPTGIDHAEEVARYSQMWRIADDHWDLWLDKNKHNGEFPFGLAEEFDRIALWNKYSRPGSWPDPDMLPEGSLRPHPGLGEPRHSRYTPDEQRTEFTLFCISRSPLIFGGNLTELDDLSRRLMTSRELTGIDQTATEARPVTTRSPEFGHTRVWFASTTTAGKPTYYFAFFNPDEGEVKLHFKWNDIWLRFGGKHTATNLWDGVKAGPAEDMDLSLPAHGSAVFRVE
ncbi:glycoside hydrolase family 27 protein [Acidobacteria bacterium AB60]|nr:glycoside hydrolase family 27 protein [Acidobacteria bacterium AB60]